MARKAVDINYEEVINRQQKRISELRKDLAHYNSQLRHLRRRAKDNDQASLDAATAAMAATTAAAILQAQGGPADYSGVQGGHMRSSLSPNHHVVPQGGAPATQAVLPRASRRENVKSGEQRRDTGERVRKESSDTGVRTKRNESDNSSIQNTRYWTEREHSLFLYATKVYGPKNYAAISQFVQTRTPKQVRTHAQKYQIKLEREAKINQSQVARPAMTIYEGETRGSKARSEKSMDRDEKRRKGGTKRSGKGLSSGPSTDSNENMDKRTLGLNELASYDDFMKMISGSAEGASVKRTRVFGDIDELDLKNFDDCINTKPENS
eukprot:GFKZ01004014.1.p1 GENE.GFKZ01004014.1~~GFKZ01004014.1.p1  ORF type:complete len:323 (-),score=51.59 GFKZ01004014.1:492-1460(-)